MLQRLQAIREREDGFTLIELLIVIVILGVLAAIVVFGVSGINDTSKTSACKSDLKSVEIASEAYYANKSPHAYATAIDDATHSATTLVGSGFLREAPSSSDYTISYSSTGGVVTAAHGATAGCP